MPAEALAACAPTPLGTLADSSNVRSSMRLNTPGLSASDLPILPISDGLRRIDSTSHCPDAVLIRLLNNILGRGRRLIPLSALLLHRFSLLWTAYNLLRPEVLRPM